MARLVSHEERKNIRVKAYDFWSKHLKSEKIPYDLKKTAAILGYSVEEVNNICGDIKAKIDHNLKKIWIATKFTEKIRRTALAHEIAHIILDPTLDPKEDIQYYGNALRWNDANETAVKYFAANMLMPVDIMVPLIEKTKGDVSWISEELGISKGTVLIQFEAYGGIISSPMNQIITKPVYYFDFYGSPISLHEFTKDSIAKEIESYLLKLGLDLNADCEYSVNIEFPEKHRKYIDRLFGSRFENTNSAVIYQDGYSLSLNFIFKEIEDYSSIPIIDEKERKLLENVIASYGDSCLD